MTTQTKTDSIEDGEFEQFASEPAASEPTAIAPARAFQSVPASIFADAGLIVPPVSPEQVRSLFHMRQQFYTALLDPGHDFLYSVPYTEHGKPREYMTTSLKNAEIFATQYKTEYKARPRKSGVEKLAESLGIQGEVTESRGLPNEKTEDYAMVRYKATHVRTGRVAYGVGWCDRKERATMSNHALIATADSRSFSRAVLRLIGYGEVGAEEILAGISDDVDVTVDMTPPSAAMGRTESSVQAKASISGKMTAAAADKAVSDRTKEIPPAEHVQVDPNEQAVHLEWSERKGLKFTEDGFNMAVIRPADPQAPRFTKAQAADFTKVLVTAFEGDKQICKRFLRQHAGVNSTTELSVDTIDRLTARLRYITTGTPF